MRLAIVTGGSRGLGAELCQQLAEQGYELIEFSRGAPYSYSQYIDLADPLLSAERVAKALLHFKDVTLDEVLMINNAGVLDPIGVAMNYSPHQLLANLNANFCSAILIISEVIRTFQAHSCQKRIANISSGAANKGYAGWSLYCASKAGMENFVASVAMEQKHQAQAFDVINIDPGVMDTEMQATIRTVNEVDFPDVARFIQRKETGGLIAPAQTAKAVIQIVQLATLDAGSQYVAADYFANSIEV